jgi:hypothetical protein
MITKIPFNWDDPNQLKIIDKYKVSGLSGYSGYYPCDFQFFSRDIISGDSNGNKWKLEVTPEGNEPVNWVSGILDNKDNYYSAFVKSVTHNPKYIFE